MRQLNLHPRLALDLSYFQSLVGDTEQALKASVPEGSWLDLPSFVNTEAVLSTVTVRSAAGSQTLRVLPLTLASSSVMMTALGLTELSAVSKVNLPLQELQPGLLSDPVVPTWLVGSNPLVHQGLFDRVTIGGTAQDEVSLLADGPNLRMQFGRVRLFNKTPLPEGSASAAEQRLQTLALWKSRYPVGETDTELQLEFALPTLDSEEQLFVEVQGLSGGGLGLVQRIYLASSLAAAPAVLSSLGNLRYRLTLNKTLLRRDGLSDFDAMFLRIFSAKLARTVTTSSRLQGIFDFDVPVTRDLTGLDLYVMSDATGEVLDLRSELAAQPELLSPTSSGQLVLRLNLLSDPTVLPRIDLSGDWRVYVSNVPVDLTRLTRQLLDTATSTEGIVTIYGVPGLRLTDDAAPSQLPVNRDLFLSAEPYIERDNFATTFLVSGQNVVLPQWLTPKLRLHVSATPPEQHLIVGQVRAVDSATYQLSTWSAQLAGSRTVGALTLPLAGKVLAVRLPTAPDVLRVTVAGQTLDVAVADAGHVEREPDGAFQLRFTLTPAQLRRAMNLTPAQYGQPLTLTLRTLTGPIDTPEWVWRGPC